MKNIMNENRTVKHPLDGNFRCFSLDTRTISRDHLGHCYTRRFEMMECSPILPCWVYVCFEI